MHFIVLFGLDFKYVGQLIVSTATFEEKIGHCHRMCAERVHFARISGRMGRGMLDVDAAVRYNLLRP